MRISDWSSDVCSSDLFRSLVAKPASGQAEARKFRLFEVEERLFQRQAAIPDDNAGDQGDRHDGTGNPHGCRIWRIGGQAQDCLGREKAQNAAPSRRSEEHTSELQSLMRISYAVFCLKKKKNTPNTDH